MNVKDTSDLITQFYSKYSNQLNTVGYETFTKFPSRLLY